MKLFLAGLICALVLVTVGLFAWVLNSDSTAMVAAHVSRDANETARAGIRAAWLPNFFLGVIATIAVLALSGIGFWALAGERLLTQHSANQARLGYSQQSAIVPQPARADPMQVLLLTLVGSMTQQMRQQAGGQMQQGMQYPMQYPAGDLEPAPQIEEPVVNGDWWAQ